MTFSSLFLLLAKPLIHNIPKAMTLILILCLFLGRLVNLLGNKWKKNSTLNLLGVTLIIGLGLYTRICFAYFFPANFDLKFWNDAANFAVEGKNIYVATSLWNYFPPWIIILKFLKEINLLFPAISFNFIVRFFLTLVDCLTLYVLFLLTRLNRISFTAVAAGFFLNPISIIITGLHGQFENIAVLFILLGIYLYQKKKKFYFAWLAFTFGGIVKHMFFNQVLLFLNLVFKNNKRKVIQFFCFSLLVAFATLLPYWKEGSRGIINNLFLCYYKSKNYGVTYIFRSFKLDVLSNIYRYLFLVLFFGAPLLIKGKNLLRLSLLGTLFFIVFTPGISNQYFLMPIAIGVLIPSLLFYLYTIIVSLYLLGSDVEFIVASLRAFPINLIWLVSIFWFLSEYFKNRTVKSWAK